MLNQLVQIPNQLLSHLDGLVQTDSPWLDRSTIKSVAGQRHDMVRAADLYHCFMQQDGPGFHVMKD